MRQQAGSRTVPHAPGLLPDWPAVPDLVAIEHHMLRRWAEREVFRRSAARTAGGPRWTCYENPPAAGGMPGIHHVPGWAARDSYQRMKAMQGFDVYRGGGWDCHGLPVEVAVEKELGLFGLADIEAYGAARFSARCRESAQRHVDAFAALSTRMGCWLDNDRAYRTMDPGYIDAVWWSLRRIFDAGLLVRRHQIAPYCPRCQTPLAWHELGLPDVRRKIPGSEAVVRFSLDSLPEGASPQLRGADLLVWTSAPWTLLGNAGIAVHPHQTYALARRAGQDDRVIVAESRLTQVLGENWHVAARLSGAQLVGATYRPAVDVGGMAGPGHVIPGYFVTTKSGTGLVHLAPAFGTDGLEAGRAHGLSVVDPIGQDGRIDRALPLVGGAFFADADPILIDLLAEGGRLIAGHHREHSCPHCWRCGTPLLFRALSAWYIRTTAVRDRLRAESERTRWEPPQSTADPAGGVPHGEADWLVSRTRIWGTPLPLWECSSGHVTCAGSLAELSELAGIDLTGLDPHRPYIDGVTIACPQCRGIGRRVPEVIDAGYDTGCMPFAQYGTPPGSPSDHQAQLVAESAAQAGGWFSALQTVGTLLFGRAAFGAGLRVGAVLDESGRGMSRNLGNLVDPVPLIERYGADAVRWFCAVAIPPGVDGKMSRAALDQIVRKVLLTYWNTVAFLVSYASAAARKGRPWRPGEPAAPPYGARPLLDRWILSELQTMVGDVTADLTDFRSAAAGARIAGFVDTLSNWYLRSSRRRFRHGPATAECAAAFATLYECLEVLTRVMAPFTPFLADYVWTVISSPEARAPDSVHLATWPEPVPALIDDQLARQVALARRLAELGRSARATAGIRIRQPLARARIAADKASALGAELRAQLAQELNVRSIESLAAFDDEGARPVVCPNFRALGRRFGRDTQAVATSVERANPAAVIARLSSAGTFAVPLNGALVDLSAGELIVTRYPRAGWAVAAGGREMVALDIAISPELRREGLAREVIRTVQAARKADGLEVGDQIALGWQADDADLALALTEHGPMISADVLAAEYGQGPAAGSAADGTCQHVNRELGLTFSIRKLSS